MQEKIKGVRDEISKDIRAKILRKHRQWIRNNKAGEAHVSNNVLLRMRYGLRVLADLPGMVDLIREHDSVAGSATFEPFNFCRGDSVEQ